MQRCLGWVLCCFIQSWGKKFISNPTLLSTSQQMAKVLCYQLMWTPAWEDQGKLLPSLNIKCCSSTVRAEQSSCQDTLTSKAHLTPAEVNCISATQEETKPHSFIFTTIPWPPPYGESTTGRLGTSSQDSHFCQALKGQNIFQLERADHFLVCTKQHRGFPAPWEALSSLRWSKGGTGQRWRALLYADNNQMDFTIIKLSFHNRTFFITSWCGKQDPSVSLNCLHEEWWRCFLSQQPRLFL